MKARVESRACAAAVSPGETRDSLSPRGRRAGIFTWSVGGLCALCAVLLLHACFAAFTRGKFSMFDYGVYTNMIWNSGHGSLFRVLVDRSYLQTHLSFTLALLGPLYRLWDHPFLLSFLQWAMLVGGGGILWRVMVRERVAKELAAAVLLLYLAHPYLQSVVLSEFHGVSLYLFLVPWLYYTLNYRKGTVWLPLILILGLREDAFYVPIPFLLYVAARDKWKGGYLYAAASIAYGVLATAVLFPMVSGMLLLARRPQEFHPALTWDGLYDRGRALLWVLLPTVPLWRRRPAPAFLLPLLPLGVAMGSGFWRQYSLTIHYPAAVMTALVAGIVETLVRHRRREGERGPPGDGVKAALGLVAVTLAAQWAVGCYRGVDPLAYLRVHPYGIKSLEAAGHLPREGVLVVPRELAPFCANRADLLTWNEERKTRIPFDLVFENLKLLRRGDKAMILPLLEGMTFGVRYFDGMNFILQRGYSADGNDAVLKARERFPFTVRLSEAVSEAGRDESVPGGLYVRAWPGGAGSPVLIASGLRCTLGPGAYEARVSLRTGAMKADHPAGAGRIALFPAGGGGAIAEAEIVAGTSEDAVYRTQVIRFELVGTMEIEPRVWGGDVPLWVDTVVFVRDGGGEEG